MSAEAGAMRGGSRLAEIAVIGLSVIVLFAALIWIAGLAGVEETPESVGSSLSQGPRGALALYRWLERSGFQVSRVEAGQEFPPSANTLLMINPNDDFPSGQAGSVRRWVEDGNTLILATGRTFGDLGGGLGGRHPMLRELGVGLDFAEGYTPTVPLAQPIFSRPPVSYVDIPSLLSLELPISDTTVPSR